MVRKQVPTLEPASKERYSDDELEEFRKIILSKLHESDRSRALLDDTLAKKDSNGTDDTYVGFKGLEEGSSTLDREHVAELASRQQKYINELQNALRRIQNKNYGICRVTGRLISKERLRLVPHATLSIEGKQQLHTQEKRN